MQIVFNSLSLQAWLESFMLLTSRFSQTSGIRKFLTSFIFIIDILILILMVPLLIIIFPFKLLYILVCDYIETKGFVGYILYVGILWDLAFLFVYNFICFLLYKFIYFTSLSMGKCLMEKMDSQFESAFKNAYSGGVIDMENDAENDDVFSQKNDNNNLYIINMDENNENI